MVKYRSRTSGPNICSKNRRRSAVTLSLSSSVLSTSNRNTISPCDVISFADGDCRILSGRGNRHRAELLAQRDPPSMIYFVRAKALSSRETVSLFDSEDMELIGLIFPFVKSSEFQCRR